MKEFSEKFKQAKIHELLKIILESDRHNPKAIEAAKSELENRGIWEEELQKILGQISQRDKKVEAEPLQIEYTRTTTEGIETVIIDEEDAAQQRKRAIDTQIIILTIVFSLIAINNFVSDSSLLKHFFASNFAILSSKSFPYLLLLFILPMGIFTFWLRYRIGWFVLIFYSICSIIMSACLVAVSLNWMIFDLFYVMGSPLQYILNSLIYLVLLYVLWISDLRAVFNTSKLVAFIVTSATELLVLLMMYVSF